MAKQSRIDYSLVGLCKQADEVIKQLDAGNDEAIHAFEHLVGLLVTSAAGYVGRDSPQRRLLYFGSNYASLTQDRDTDDAETAELTKRTAAEALTLRDHALKNAEFVKLVAVLGYGKYLP